MLELLLTYKYFILIPLSIAEGPIVSVVCGFLVTLKVFNPLLVFMVMVLGDIIGDGIFYYIGYSGKKILPYFGATEEKLAKAKLYFEQNHKKAIAGSKIMWGIGTVGLIAAGALRIPYKRYFMTCALYSLAQSFTMIMLGVFFGQSYLIIEKYFNYYAALVSVVALAILLFILFRKYKAKKKTSL